MARSYASEILINLGMRGFSAVDKIFSKLDIKLNDVILGTDKFKSELSIIEKQLEVIGEGDKLTGLAASFDAKTSAIEEFTNKYSAGIIDVSRTSQEQLNFINRAADEGQRLYHSLRAKREKAYFGKSQIEKELKSVQVKLESAPEGDKISLKQKEIELNDKLRKQESILESVSMAGLEQLPDKINALNSAYQTMVDDAENVKKINEELEKSITKLGEAFDPIIEASPEFKKLFDIFKTGFNVLKPLTDDFKKKMSGALFNAISGRLGGSSAKTIAAGIKGAAPVMTKSLNGVAEAAKAAGVAQEAIAAGAVKAAGGLKTAGGTATGLSAALQGAGGSASGFVSKLAAIGPQGLLVVGALAGAVVQFAAFVYGLKVNIDTMEKFRLAGYRATGSISELTRSVYDLSAATGLNTEESIRVIEAISKSGYAVGLNRVIVDDLTGSYISNDAAIKRVSVAIGKFSKATGVSELTTARLLKRISQFNTTIQEQEALFGQLSVAAERYGLMGEELDGIIDSLRRDSLRLEMIWRDTNINKYTQSVLALSGAAKQLGFDIGVVNEITSDVTGATDAALALAAIGGDISAFTIGGDDAASRAMESQIAGATRILQMAEQMPPLIRARYLQAFGGEEKLRLLSSTNYREELDRNRSLSEADAARNNALVEAQRSLDTTYSTSLTTITQSLQRIAAPILNLMAKAIEPIATGLAELFSSIDLSSIQQFGEMFNVMLGDVGTLLSEVGGLFKDIFVAFGPTIKNIGKIFGTFFVGAFRLGANIMISAVRVIRIITNVIMQLLWPAIMVVNTAFEAIGSAFEWVYERFSDLMGAWDRGLGSLIAGAQSFLMPWNRIYDLFGYIKSLLFGSSFLHINEGIREVLPSIDILGDNINSLSPSLQSVRDSMMAMPTVMGPIGVALQYLDDANQQIMPAKLTIDDSELSPTPIPVTVDDSEFSPVRTVQFTEDKRRADNVSALISNTDDMILLLSQILNKEDENTKRSADKLEELVNKKDKIDYKPLHSGFGERTNQWWGK